MKNNWLYFIDINGDPFVSQISSFGDSSLHHSRNIALQEAFSRLSKFAGALVLWCSNSNKKGLLSNSILGRCKSSPQVKHIRSGIQNMRGFWFGSGSKEGSFRPVMFGNIMSSLLKCFFKEAGQFQSLPLLSLAAPVPPFNNLSTNVLAVPLENNNVQIHRGMDQIPCHVEREECPGHYFAELNSTRQKIEPRTGIEFPTILVNLFSKESNPNFPSEVLVGTGSKNMTIVKIKSLKIYAFGFYIHPYSLCEKLGPKYGSIPLDELNKCHEFYQDLLREDIGMTVRLVVNYSGMKISTVKDTLEKSLRVRLSKTNPDTDYSCLTAFGSYFTQDISLPVGTIIDFRRTSDWTLITEIGGNQIGAVQSKDLCRAFFGMYVGDVPVSEQTKEEIGRNVATIMKRC